MLTCRKIWWGESPRSENGSSEKNGEQPVFVIDFRDLNKLVVICPKIEYVLVTTFDELRQSKQSNTIFPSVVMDLSVNCTPLMKDEGSSSFSSSSLSSSFDKNTPRHHISLTPHYIN
jgi:hypothetical protein